MGFVILGEFLRFRRASIDHEIARTVANAEEANDTLDDADPDIIWGALPGRMVCIDNHLGDGDADLLLTVPCGAADQCHDWRDGEPGTLVAAQQSAHCWAYCSDPEKFDPAMLGFERKSVLLPSGSSEIAVPTYRCTPLQLMWPRPWVVSYEKAADVSPLGGSRPSEAGDFIDWLPCWPAQALLADGRGWRTLPKGDYIQLEEQLQPSTQALFDATARMDELLLRGRILSGDVGETDYHVGEYSDRITARLTPELLRLLRRRNPARVPIAWYSIQHHGETDQVDRIRELYDPEHLLEDIWDRYDRYGFDEPPPGQSSVDIYYHDRTKLRKKVLGEAIVAAARAAGLDASWQCDPERAITVRLPANWQTRATEPTS